MEKNLARCLRGSFLSYASINFRVEWFAFFSEKFGWCNNFESNANRQQLCRFKKKIWLNLQFWQKKNFCTNCHQAVITLFYFIRTADFFLLQAATTVQSLKECSHVFFFSKAENVRGCFLASQVFRLRFGFFEAASKVVPKILFFGWAEPGSKFQIPKSSFKPVFLSFKMSETKKADFVQHILIKNISNFSNRQVPTS